MPQAFTSEEREEILARLGQVFETPAAEALMEVLDRVAIRRAEMVTRQDFQEIRGEMAQLVAGQRALQQAVTRLTEAQTHSEERLARFEEAMIRSEERMGQLEDALTRLTEAQTHSEERLARLEEAMIRSEERLARLEEVQIRSEQRLGGLEEAMTRLADAQARTEKELRRLARQVGGLSDRMGGDLEDKAYQVLPKVLKQELGWTVGALERVWQRWNGEVEEVNIFGQASDPARPDQPIWIVGEAKHNLRLNDVRRFIKQVERARQHLEGEVFPVCFCYRARPEVQKRLKDLNIRLVFSYGRMI